VVGTTTVVTGAPQTIAGNAAAGSLVSATATCATGKAISGGGTVTVSTGAGKLTAALSESRPLTTTTNPTAWQATAIVTVTGTGGGTVTAYVICG
jgi:hypothetical protein